MIEHTFGHQAFLLMARAAGNVHGVLPLVQVRSKFFGNRMISQAFSNYGGPVADGHAASVALYNRAVELAVEHGCESIEFRNTELIPYDLHLRVDKVCMRYPLVSDVDELWNSFSSRSGVRNHVRKAQQFGITVVSGGEECLEEFYRVWAVRMRELGTPCYPRKLFCNILKAFPDNARIFLGRLKGRTIGARFTVSFNGLAQSRWGATLVKYNGTRVNHYLYWTVMKYYAEAGAKWFDFGRSSVGSTQYKFKKQWGTKPVPLYYQYWVRPGKEFSVVSPDAPKYRRKAELWKKLPLWMTRLIGPYIGRNLA